MNIKNSRPYIFLFVIILLGYWQVSFFVYGLKWDLIDVVLPFRYYFSECIQSGYFPFWNPYQQTGTPFFTDLQAPVYYPELLIVSLLGGYGIYTMHILFIMYLFLAATGMYKLSFYFNKNITASILAGLAYSFSGFVVGHGQHFFLLVGTAWIPFVLLSYLKLNDKTNLIETLKACLFVFLMITGAYQALSIALMYLLLVILIYYLIKTLVEKEVKKTFQIIRYNLLFAIIVVILCLPLIFSTAEIMGSVTRLEHGVDLNKSLAFGQPITTFLSFLLPFSTLKNAEFFGGIDFSLINHYFGIIAFIFFFLSLFARPTTLRYLILGFGTVIFLMSFDFWPLRQFFYDHVPLMNLFVSAAYISVFGTIGFILFSANYFAHFIKNPFLEKNKVIAGCSIVICVLLRIIFCTLKKMSIGDFHALMHANGIEDLFHKLSFHHHVFFQSVFQVIILSGFIVCMFFYRRLKHPVSLIIMLMVTDIVVATQLNMNTTVIDMKHSPENMQRDLDLCPESFPVPIDDKIIFNDQEHAFFSPFWRNTYIFTKQVSFDAFSSFQLDTYRKLDENIDLKNSVLNNHLFYFSDTILPINAYADRIAEPSPQLLYFSEEEYELLSQKTLKTSSTDSLWILEFDPNHVSVRTRTSREQLLTLLQTNYKGWKATIDHQQVPIYTSNYNYRSVILPEGEHIVRYEYSNNKVLILYILSNIVFIICVLTILSYGLYKKTNQKKLYLYIPVAIFILVLLIVAWNLFHKKQYDTIFPYHHARYKKEKVLKSVRLTFEEEKTNPDTHTVYSGKKSYKIRPDNEYLPLVEWVLRSNEIKKGTLIVKARVNMTSYCKALLVSEIKGEWHAGKLERHIEHLKQWNEIIYYRNITNMKEGETIKVYIWNPGKYEFNVDDISLEIYE